jgi:hypothetical protein
MDYNLRGLQMTVKIDGTLGINKVQDGSITSSSLVDSIRLPGAPTTSTAPAGTNTEQIANTAFVAGEIAHNKGGRKNYLINGNFDKWDYATSQTLSGYIADNRWWNGNNGSTKTVSQQVCGDVERALFNAAYFSRTATSGVVGAGNFVCKVQPIENVSLLAGRTVTLSFWAKADANRNIAIEFYQNFGTGGNPSVDVPGIGSQLVALTTNWQKYTITVTIPSIVGKVIGTDGAQTTSTKLFFWFDAGINFATRTANLGQQSGTFDIAQVKLEDGYIATNGWDPYDGEFGGEIEACARYYEVGTVMLTGIAYPNGDNRNWMDFKVVKRVVPTVSVDNPNLSVICTGGGGATNYPVSVAAIIATLHGWRISSLGNANNMNSANGTVTAAWGDNKFTTYYASAEL